MNKTFTLFSIFLFLSLMLSTSLLADVCVATMSGDWEDSSIWDCGHVPEAGDDITIGSGITVTVNESHDYNEAGDPPTFITIEGGGFLIFDTPCNNGTCKIDFRLADGSTIDVKGADGIDVAPGDASKVKVWIGNDLVLHGSNGANGFPFGPGTLPDGALPVELNAFNGLAMERSNMLKWQTASEENTMAFIVERSLDGRSDFIEVGRVNAVGNSTTLRNYEIEDLTPVSLAYYRLRIVDFDGTFEFSDIIAVERTKTEIDLVETFPNPAEEEVTVLVHVQKEGKAIMILSDFLGRTIKQEKVNLKSGINRYTLNWEDQETNFYYLTIDNGSEKIVKKILRASKQ